MSSSLSLGDITKHPQVSLLNASFWGKRTWKRPAMSAPPHLPQLCGCSRRLDGVSVPRHSRNASAPPPLVISAKRKQVLRVLLKSGGKAEQQIAPEAREAFPPHPLM